MKFSIFPEYAGKLGGFVFVDHGLCREPAVLVHPHIQVGF